jgi:hypothetical protein
VTEYKQRCPACLQMPRTGRHAACWLCNGTERLRGNGSAQMNPARTRPAVAYDESQARNWDNIVRADEDVA